MSKESLNSKQDPSRRDILKAFGALALSALPHKINAQEVQKTSESAQREMRWAELLGSAEKIMAKVTDKELNEIWKFLKMHGLVSTPIAGGDYHTAGRATEPAISIIPMLPQDQELSVWKEVIRGRNAVYLYPSRVMIFSSLDDLSPTFQGLTVLHESIHAFSYEQNPRKEPESPADYKEVQEKFVREQMKKIMVSLGGADYQKLIDSQVQYIQKELDGLPAINKPIPPLPPYNEDIDKIFTVSKSETERSTRRTELYIHAWLEFLDKYYAGEDKELLKTKVVFTLAPSR